MMIACVPFGTGFFILLLAPLGLCYLCSMYDVLKIICDKHKNIGFTVFRNISVITISAFYIIILGSSDRILVGVCVIPVLVSVTSMAIHFLRLEHVKN